MSDNRFLVNTSPHFRSSMTVQKVMLDVIIALIPAMIASVYFFGMRSLYVTLVAVISCVATEAITNKFIGKKDNTITDLSAVLTGILLAFVLPVTIPFWMVVVGSFISIFVAKQVFGGLGNNIFNPAHVGRAFLLASWPVAMTKWTSVVDATTCATPLGILKEVGIEKLIQTHTIMDMFIGNIPGSIGETSVLAILIGAAYLFYRGHITWQIPVAFLGTVAVLAFIFGGKTFFDPMMIPIHLFTGGLMIGAFFMATDMVTSPMTSIGRLIFGFGCGLLVVLIRKWGAYPEGVCYSILIMNSFTPIIDKYAKEKVFGEVK